MMHVDANARQSLGWGRALIGGGLLVAVLLGTAGAYPLDLASIRADEKSTVLRLETHGKYGQLPHEVFCLEEPFRVVVDIFGADAPVAVDPHPGGMVAEVRSSVWKDEPEGRVVRYVIETNEPTTYHTQTTSGMLEIVLGRPADDTIPAEDPTALRDASMAVQQPPVDTGDVEGPRPEGVRAEQDHGASTRAQSVMSGSGPATHGTATVDPLSMSVAYAAAPPTSASHAAAHADQTELAAEAMPEDAAPAMGLADPRFAPDDQSNAGGGRAMNLDVQNADVRTVFRSIAEFGGTNIVADRDVAGPVSIHLVNVPWRRALDIVCQSAALTAIDGEEVVRVATLKTLASESLERETNARKREEYLPLEVHVFVVGYAGAGELLEAVRPILSDRGTVNADSRTNSLIVTDIPPRVEEVASLIRSLDTQTVQVEITAELVDMDASAIERLGVAWDLENLGDVSEGTSLSGNVDAGLVESAGQLRFGLIRSWGDLQARLDALSQSNDAHIISNPKITTINNHPATILVGKEIPLITLDNSGNPITELKKVGITLRVTPFVNAKNRITMDLHPEISDLSSQATVQGGLIFTTSEAQTRVMVGNGETAVIGGLIRTNETRFEQGIPVLRSIPILGALFKTTDTVKERRELVIFVTPRIVEDVASR